MRKRIAAVIASTAIATSLLAAAVPASAQAGVNAQTITAQRDDHGRSNKHHGGPKHQHDGGLVDSAGGLLGNLLNIL